jgi:pyruvate dehydrogenase E1 component alpha subunit
VLMVRETLKWAGKWVQENGPLFLELNTYRYHGHSMSDPGVTYRTKEEIMEVRQNRDPLEIARQYLIDNKFATLEETKAIEKTIRKRIDEEVEQIRKDPFPPVSELYTDIGVTKEHYVRGVEYNLTQHIV